MVSSEWRDDYLECVMCFFLSVFFLNIRFDTILWVNNHIISKMSNRHCTFFLFPIHVFTVGFFYMGVLCAQVHKHFKFLCSFIRNNGKFVVKISKWYCTIEKKKTNNNIVHANTIHVPLMPLSCTKEGKKPIGTKSAQLSVAAPINIGSVSIGRNLFWW